MEEFVAYIIKNLVSNPGAVQVSSSDEQEEIRIEIRVASEDAGKVIGRRGNTINALRTIVRTVATRLGKRAQVELIQPDQTESIVETATPEAAETEEEVVAQEETPPAEEVEDAATTEETEPAADTAPPALEEAPALA